jgi:hypothetical protein
MAVMYIAGARPNVKILGNRLNVAIFGAFSRGLSSSLSMDYPDHVLNPCQKKLAVFSFMPSSFFASEIF